MNESLPDPTPVTEAPVPDPDAPATADAAPADDPDAAPNADEPDPVAFAQDAAVAPGGPVAPPLPPDAQDASPADAPAAPSADEPDPVAFAQDDVPAADAPATPDAPVASPDGPATQAASPDAPATPPASVIDAPIDAPTGVVAGATGDAPAATPPAESAAPADAATEAPAPPPAATPAPAALTRTAADNAEVPAEVPSDPEATTTFADLGLRKELLAALTELGYEEPTPIQKAAIGPLVEGRDLLGRAATGTGKTAAFALPLLERMTYSVADRGRAPSGLVLVPTRELAEQVSEAVHRYGRGLGARVLPVYGGSPIVRQLKVLQRGVDVVVATPGRAVDHLKRGSLDLSELSTVVLDEADEMLDMGFAEDLEALLSATPKSRQAVLFSATMPRRIDRMAQQHLNDPVRALLAAEETPKGEAPLVRQTAYVVARPHKPAALGRILDVEQPTAAIVFCRTRAEVDELTVSLNGRGYRAEALHGGLDQQARSRVVDRLKAGTTELVVATDVAARGLDVDVLTHVVNYDVPSSPEAYVHRIGRVGRAGREGVAITLAQPREHHALRNVERLTGKKIATEPVPTVADLRSRQREQTVAALREVLAEGDLDGLRPVVEQLVGEHDVVDIALAAVRMAQRAEGVDEDEEEIPETKAPQKRGNDKGARSNDRNARPDRGGPRDRQQGGGKPRGKGPSGPTTRLYVSAGRAAGVRPQDIVGAFCNESSLTGRDVGAIELHDKFALVEVPEDQADAVVGALRGTTIKGRKANVRRERYENA